MIRFSCTCGKLMQAKEEYAGRKTRCPECDRELPIPAPSQNIEPEDRGRPAPVREADRPERKARRRRREEDDYEEDDRPRRPAATSGKAIGSLVCGLLGIFCLLPWLLSLILGILALKDIGQSRGRLRGRGLAIAGMIIPVIGLVLVVPLIVFGTQRVRQAATRAQCQNNLKALGLAMHNYHDTNRTFPPAVVRDRRGQPLYSWRVLLLPYVGYGDLYHQFRLNEPWDSPHNRSLLSRMPDVYSDRGAPSSDGTTTPYQVLVGPDTGFPPDRPGRMVEISDGSSNTLMVVEADTAVPWSKPADLTYAANQPLPRFASFHGDGFNAVFFNGEVRFIKSSTREQTLRALITARGGEVVDPGELDR